MNAPLPFLTHWTQINAKHVAQAVKELGANSVLISSDLGQSGNIVHPDGLMRGPVLAGEIQEVITRGPGLTSLPHPGPAVFTRCPNCSHLATDRDLGAAEGQRAKATEQASYSVRKLSWRTNFP